MKAAAQRSGFTLIELLVAVFVLAIGLGVIFALLTMTTNLGREQRDEARLRRFAETVFASVDWELNGQPTLDPYEWTALTSEGVVSSRLVVDGTEGIWPPLDDNPLEPSRIRYRMDRVSLASGLVEVKLSVGMWGGGEETVFTRTFIEVEPTS